MRHELFTLDTATAARTAPIRESLMVAHSDGKTVTVTGTKRDSTERFTRTGDIVGFVGSIGMSNEGIVIDTDAGPRTFNVWLIDSVTAL